MVTPSAECSADAVRLREGKKRSRRLRVFWRTAASEHGRSYAITLHLTTNLSAKQGLSRKRVERRPLRLWSVWFIWFVWSIRFVWFNQIHKTNQTNQKDQPARYRRRSRPWGVVRSWSGPRGTMRVGLMSLWVM